MSRAESKEHVRARMDEEWPKFQALLDSVPESEFDVPGVTDQWCLKELLGHIVFWADKAAHDVTAAADGRTDEIKVPDGDGVADQWNAEAAAKGKPQTAQAIKADVARAHEAARQALEAAPESALAIEVSGWSVGLRYAADTYRHYREHAEQIRAWLQQLETTEA